MTIYERLHYLALGGRSEYQHKRGRENKQTTKLQNFLDTVKVNTNNREGE